MLSGDISRDATKFIINQVKDDLKVSPLSLHHFQLHTHPRVFLPGRRIRQPRTVYSLSEEGFLTQNASMSSYSDLFCMFRSHYLNRRVPFPFSKRPELLLRCS
jgi:hypothetical protein